VHAVRIEVLLLSISCDDQLNWRMVSGALPAGCRPDARARELAGLVAIVPPRRSCTPSWRPSHAGLTLTYAVCRIRARPST
jgi:hypothetical protein